MKDWRLTGQEEYMSGISLINQSSCKIKSKPDTWHEHCEFCMQEINNRYDQICYSSRDEYRWICSKCYFDFKDMFKWSIEQDFPADF